MSQKYKNLSKGSKQASDCISILPPDVKRVGYLRKLKKMKRRFFVLYMDSEVRSARLEYYGSEKKWKCGCEPRRCIELRFCLNISRKLHSKQKNVIAFYTQDDCFCIVTDSVEELELWLSDILEVYRTNASGDENVGGRATYEHLWQVVIDKHDLECSQSLTGPYRVALSSRALILIKMSPSNKCDYLEFPLMSIRRCGHSKDHFFIELGRSAVTGAGEIYMATEGTLIAQNMHETVLSAMKSSKIREDGTLLPRPRSASTSENSNPVATRRPVGIVAPQTLTSSNSYVLSGSRERCDSLPTRPKTLVENSQNGIVLSFSPCSMSSAGGNVSSNEDMDNLKVQSFGSHFNSKSADGITPSDLPISEVPDEYLMMSPSDNTSAKQCGKIEKETCKVINPVILSLPKQASVSNNPTYISMAQTSSSKNKSVVPESYVSMSPVNNPSTKPTFYGMNSSNKSNADCFQENNAFISSKVSSVDGGKDSSKALDVKSQSEYESCDNTPASDKFTNFCFSSNLGGVKFHSLHKTNKVTEHKEKIPIVPPHRNDQDLKAEAKKSALESCVKENVKCIQIEENCETEENSNFNYNKKRTDISPVDQNTNFNCQVNSERCSKSLLPCANSCSETEKSHTNYAASYILLEPRQDVKRKQKNTQSRISDMESASNSHELIQFHLSNTFPGSKNFNFPGKSEDAISHSQDDYVNLEFKSTSGSSLCLSTQIQSVQKVPSTQCASDPSYSNINLGKPFCPSPNPTLAKLETTVPSYSSSIKAEKAVKSDQIPSSCVNVNCMNFPDATRIQKSHKSPTSTLSIDPPKPLTLTPKFRNIPNTLPAFRKQMSAPAAPPSLRPELPSPGRKSSCPVTASVSMIKQPHPTTAISGMKPSLGILTSHLKVSSSRSPDHSSVSSISSASDEISSNHSSPKIVNASQNFRQHFPDSQYENVVLPPKLPTHKRTPSASDEKELNYASLDLAPSIKDDLPSSPTAQKSPEAKKEEPLLYAEIDFTKSEGLKNTSGIFRDSRL